jgi:putative transposase
MPTVSVRQLCRWLGVNRRWYYQRRQRPSPQEREQRLQEAMEPIILSFPGYGYRRVTHALKRAGWQVNHKRVLRLMREQSWLCHRKRRTAHTTDSRHRYRRYANLVAGQQFDAPDQCWVADLTYIRLPSEFVYLAAILDRFSRKCLGWSLGRGLDSSLTLHALEMALQSREVSPGLIHHSDQGVQYANTAYVNRLYEVGARISMAAVGNPYQNGAAESFMKTLKVEEVYLNDYQTLEEARANIDHFLSQVYNEQRLHSALGYRPPSEFEQLYYQGLLT